LKENQNYASDASKRNFKGETLAYVTPWNNHGYDIAKIFNNKFTYVSPVWFQIHGGQKPHLGGLHDIDEGWVADVRGKSTVKIVPRFLFENIVRTPADAFAKSEEIYKLVVDLCVKHKFDGIVLDGVSGVLPQRVADGVTHSFIKGLADALHEKNKEFILVVPAHAQAFGADEFKVYSPFVDRFSLMTYDHSTFKSPGPVAPLPWVFQTIQALNPGDYSGKIMMGLNFYGFDFRPEYKDGNALVANQYLQILKKENPKILWDSESQEHYFTYTKDGHSHLVYYPTLKSIHERLKLAESMGISVAIWETGQGLDYFYDLL